VPSKKAQAVRVAREVRRHPVQQHADAVLMAVIHKVHEVVGRAEAAGRRKVAGHLIAPRTVEGVLGDGQQFDVRVAHLLGVLHKLMRQVAIGEEAVVLGRALPTAEMHLVDAHRLVQRLALDALLHPFCVVPV
jgi:hypothetical protein